MIWVAVGAVWLLVGLGVSLIVCRGIRAAGQQRTAEPPSVPPAAGVPQPRLPRAGRRPPRRQTPGGPPHVVVSAGAGRMYRGNRRA